MDLRRIAGRMGLIALLSISGCSIGTVKKEIPPVLEFDFSEGQGMVLHDKSGGGNRGTIHGAAWAKDSNGTTFLEFDGNDDYIEVAYNPALFNGENFTIEMTLKPGHNEKKKGFGQYRLILGQNGELWDKDSAFGIAVSEESGNLFAYFRYGPENTMKNNQVFMTDKIAVAPDAWQKITCVKKGNSVKLYVNSSEVSFCNSPEKIMIPSGRPLRIGGVPSRYFKGAFKSIKIYDYAVEMETSSALTKSPGKKKPYLLMATSMDESISSTPLLDIKKELIDVFNDSPYDGISLNLLDIYSGQVVIDEPTLLDRAKELKSISRKDIWPRINVNRIYQRKEKHCYNARTTSDAVSKIPARGAPVDKVRRDSTDYFTKIKGVDIYDEAGALSDFYDMWHKGLKFSRYMKSGIVLDFEDYNSGYIAYKVFEIARVQNKPVDDVIAQLIKIGSRLADIANEEYPDVVILTFFFNFSSMNWNKIKYIDGKAYYPAYSYIAQGILMRAKEKNIPLTLVEGGECELQYVNRTLDNLENNILKRRFFYAPWLDRFPENLKLGGTITLWDDPAKLSAWTKTDAGDPNPFRSLNDFTPYLRMLFKNYDYIWFYQPACVDYKPFSLKDLQYTKGFHDKLDKVIENALNE